MHILPATGFGLLIKERSAVIMSSLGSRCEACMQGRDDEASAGFWPRVGVDGFSTVGSGAKGLFMVKRGFGASNLESQEKIEFKGAGCLVVAKLSSQGFEEILGLCSLHLEEALRGHVGMSEAGFM